MVDTFYIGAYWKNRKQLLANVINPTLQTLQELAETDEQFLKLYELGISRKHALQHQISLTSDYIERLYKERLKKSDIDKEGYSKIGYRLSVWTGHQDGEESNISFGIGKSSTSLNNSCSITFPEKGMARERLLTIEKVKAIIDILIRNWDPEIIVLNSRELSDSLETMNEIGWVTYLKRIKNKYRSIDKVTHEDTTQGGHLFYLKTENKFAYDYSLINQLVILKKDITK